MSTKKIPAISPSEILQEEFLEPFNISQYRLAKDINVSPRHRYDLENQDNTLLKKIEREVKIFEISNQRIKEIA